MADAGYLTIGRVVHKLKERYPDLSVSKIRYLEAEGIISPRRTPNGYRLFSQKDIQEIEQVLYLQKQHFLPLNVIKEELERSKQGSSQTPAMQQTPAMRTDPPEVREALHPLDRVPEYCDVTPAFIRQLAEAGVIQLKRSPHGRDLVEGKDFGLIRSCSELMHFGIGPKNLRMYVNAANRESGMFEQALAIYTKKSSNTQATAERFEAAFMRMTSLTNTVRDELIARRIREVFKDTLASSQQDSQNA